MFDLVYGLPSGNDMIFGNSLDNLFSVKHIDKLMIHWNQVTNIGASRFIMSLDNRALFTKTVIIETNLVKINKTLNFMQFIFINI